MSLLFRFSIFLVSLTTCSLVHADHDAHRHRTGFNFGFHYERLTLDPTIAARELVGEKANAFNFDFTLTEPPRNSRIRAGYLGFNFGMSFISYDDQGEFGQAVIDPYGFYTVENSDADAFHLYFEGGPNMPFSDFSTLDLKLGYSLPIVSERSIDYCEGCYSEDIDIDGGLYGKTGISIGSNNVSFVSQYKYFFSETNGIQDSVVFGLATRF